MVLLLAVIAGLVLSVVFVRGASEKTTGQRISLLAATKIVLVRSTVALAAGFGLGRVVAWCIDAGWLTQERVASSPVIALAVLGFCGLLSFLAFQWVMGKVSGQSVSIGLALRTAAIELGYVVVLCIGLVILLIGGGAVMSLF